MSGQIVVISGPGGVGKSTVVNKLIDKYPSLWLSRSWTTRAQRPGESDSAYVFVTEEQFLAHVEDDGFLEYTNFLGNYYGTPMPDPETEVDVILEIEVDGARQVKTKLPETLLLFIKAPSVEEQTKRLINRGDPQDKIEERLEKSAEEVNAGIELGATVIINEDLDSTVDQLWEAICKAKEASQP